MQYLLFCHSAVKYQKNAVLKEVIVVHAASNLAISALDQLWKSWHFAVGTMNVLSSFVDGVT